MRNPSIRYLILSIGLLLGVGLLHQNERLLPLLPGFVHDEVAVLERCFGETTTGRAGCAKGVHFADIHKHDLQSHHRLLSRNSVSSLFTAAR